MRRAVIQSHHSHCYSSNISNRNILLQKKHLSKATFETENTLWFRKAIFDFFSSSHKHIEDFHLHFPKKYPDPLFRQIWIPIQSMPYIPNRLLQMWIYHLQKSNDMTKIKYKITKFFQVYYFFFFGLLWSPPLVVKYISHIFLHTKLIHKPNITFLNTYNTSYTAFLFPEYTHIPRQ